jgi:hypothetical protein
LSGKPTYQALDPNRDKFSSILHFGASPMDTKARSEISVLSRVLCAAYRLFGFLLLIQCSTGLPTEAQTSPSVVPLCEVLQSPDEFDKQTIQIRGNVHLAFEEFTLDSEACPKKWPGIWLAFGGDAATPTMSTANDTTRTPGVIPKFGGVPVALDKDDNFEQFFALISARRGRDPLYHVTATLTGTFLAGNRKLQRNGTPPLPGYGHMSSFFLFVISRVDAVDADPPPLLSVSGTVTDGAGKPVVGADIYAQTVNCCQPQVMQTRSDDAGYFAIRSAGQVLTFIKAGYRPQSLVLETGRKDLHLILESTAAHDWRIPACKGVSGEQKFEGLPITVSLPPDLHSEQISSKPDSPFIIHRSAGHPFIRLSKGNSASPFGQTASWTFGSEEFTQRNLVDAEGKPIGTDAKGVRENKIFWRILAVPGQEIVEYHVASRETADLFEGVIDSACFQAH